MLNKLVSFFDKLEDHARFQLSRRPIVYALVGAVGIVLVWKGVWEMAEYIPALDGPASLMLGIVILLMSGLLVSFFIGDSIILSGYKHEKKLVERAARDIRSERDLLESILAKVEKLEKGAGEQQ